MLTGARAALSRWAVVSPEESPDPSLWPVVRPEAVAETENAFKAFESEMDRRGLSDLSLSCLLQTPPGDQWEEQGWTNANQFFQAKGRIRCTLGQVILCLSRWGWGLGSWCWGLVTTVNCMCVYSTVAARHSARAGKRVVTERALLADKFTRETISKMNLRNKNQKNREREGWGGDREWERGERKGEKALVSNEWIFFLHQRLPPGGVVRKCLSSCCQFGRQPEQSDAADLWAFRAE